MEALVGLMVLWGLLPFAAIVLGIVIDLINHPYK